MSYVTPPTFTSGTTATAADINILGDDIADLDARLNARNFSGVRMYRVAGVPQTIGDSSITSIIWPNANVTFDVTDWHASNDDFLTVPADAIPPGYTRVVVHINALLAWESDNQGGRIAALLVNGSQILVNSFDAHQSDGVDHVLTEYAVVEAGDTVELTGYQTSGGSIDVTRASLTVVVHAPLD